MPLMYWFGIVPFVIALLPYLERKALSAGWVSPRGLRRFQIGIYASAGLGATILIVAAFAVGKFPAGPQLASKAFETSLTVAFAIVFGGLNFFLFSKPRLMLKIFAGAVLLPFWLLSLAAPSRRRRYY